MTKFLSLNKFFFAAVMLVSLTGCDELDVLIEGGMGGYTEEVEIICAFDENDGDEWDELGDIYYHQDPGWDPDLSEYGEFAIMMVDDLGAPLTAYFYNIDSHFEATCFASVYYYGDEDAGYCEEDPELLVTNSRWQNEYVDPRDVDQKSDCYMEFDYR